MAKREKLSHQISKYLTEFDQMGFFLSHKSWARINHANPNKDHDSIGKTTLDGINRIVQD